MKNLFTILCLAFTTLSFGQSLDNTEWNFYLVDEFNAKFRFSEDTVFISAPAFPEMAISTYTESADTFKIVDLPEIELGCFEDYGDVIGTYLMNIQNDTMTLTEVLDECEIRVETLVFGIFVKVDPLSIENDLIDFRKVSLFPNPMTDGILNIKSDEPIDRIDIYDPMGQLLITTSNVDQIDLAPFAQKFYFVRLTKGQNSITRKIVSK